MSGGRPCGPPGMQGCQPGYDGGANGSANWSPPAPSSYMVSSKIMVVAVAVLFAVVVFILCLHVYAKWFWRTQGAVAADGAQARAGSWRRRRRRDARVQSPSAAGEVVVQSVGLEKAVIEALPTFEFDGDEMKGGTLECAVCLEDFEEGEKGRTLPKCGHHFHLECVDMWLHSHSTCPLCRASVRPDEKIAEATATATSNDHSQPPAPVIGDVQAPFMAAMRASRRRQRSRGSFQLPSLNSPAGANSLPRATGDLIEHPAPTESSTLGSEPQESSQVPPTTAVDPKALAREYETPAEIPSNVLFWGNPSHMSTTGTQPQPSASSIRAPFQVTIDIPRLGQRDAALHPANVMSPMARASASFRRLLSRGKSVVSPHDDDGLDEGGPSSHSPRTPPPPPHAS